MRTTHDRKVLTIAEGLRKLGVCRVLADPNSDFLRSFRYGLGSKLFYREADIDAYAQGNRRASTRRPAMKE